MNGKKLNVLKSWSGLLSLLFAILIFLFGTLKDCTKSYEERLKEYLSNASKYRPMILLRKPPTIKEIYYQLDTTWMKYETGIHSIKSENNLPLDGIISSLKTNISFELINVDEQPARIVAILLSDFNSLKPIIKSDFIDRPFSFNNNIYKNFYKPVKLLKGGTFNTNFDDYIIQNSTDSSFNIHLNILYTNETGVLFYTYYTINYLLTVREFLLSYDTIIKMQDYLYHRISVEGDAVQLFDWSFDSEPYSMEDAEIINNYLSDKANQIKREIEAGEVIGHP